MDELSKQYNIAAVDAFMDEHDEVKMRLVEPGAVVESVAYLRSHGFRAEQIHNCLTRYFYVDLDLLNDALATH